ncbi:MAG: DUF1460 domain-containing protein [Dysgonomonas sp.]|nr:DUF1460 domain-containing protein [Dysgonomonas sp.]
MKKIKFFALCVFCLFANMILANNRNVIYSVEDSLIFEGYVKKFASEKDRVTNQLIVETARYFLGKPYVASTLEVGEKETLVINLREFDCTTFVENCIALTMVVKSEDLSFTNYCQILREIRYRSGKVDGYPSRLHYTSDWIYENQQRGLLENISIEIGGKSIVKPVNFMSSHAHLYKQLKDNTQNIKELIKIEENINKRNNFAILPGSDIEKYKRKIEDGYIIVFSTSILGLDYSHIGIAYWQNDELYFIHASSAQKETVIEKNSLANYCKRSKSCTGISVIRLAD